VPPVAPLRITRTYDDSDDEIDHENDRGDKADDEARIQLMPDFLPATKKGQPSPEFGPSRRHRLASHCLRDNHGEAVNRQTTYQ
jgi:hypothetical protein